MQEFGAKVFSAFFYNKLNKLLYRVFRKNQGNTGNRYIIYRENILQSQVVFEI